jgi:hypothetical protein
MAGIRKPLHKQPNAQQQPLNTWWRRVTKQCHLAFPSVSVTIPSISMRHATRPAVRLGTRGPGTEIAYKILELGRGPPQRIAARTGYR